MAKEIETIFGENIVGTLATLNDDGSPWATPVHVFFDETFVYWFSKDTHQHSMNIERDPRVSLAGWVREGGTKGVYLSGDATKLEGDDVAYAESIVIQKFGAMPPVFDNTSPFRLEIGQINSSKSSENRWYFYT